MPWKDVKRSQSLGFDSPGGRSTHPSKRRPQKFIGRRSFSQESLKSTGTSTSYVPVVGRGSVRVVPGGARVRMDPPLVE